MDNKPNIIFIVMDALRARNLGCYGYSRATSPNIDKLAERGVLFKNVFSSNHLTEKSFLTIMSGRHVLLQGTKQLLFTIEELSSFFNSGGSFLQEILKKQGYKTYCLKGLYGWQKKGFDYFYNFNVPKEERTKLKETKEKIRRIFRDSAKSFANSKLPKKFSESLRKKYGRTSSVRTTEDAIRIFKESKEKKESFFMWIDYNDTHLPYNPKEFTGKFKAEKESEKFIKKVSNGNYSDEIISFWKGAFNRNETIEDVRAKYDSAIFYNDSLIGKVIEALNENGLSENTIIFFFSDHGESLGENEIYFDHHGMYDTNLHVPLIISGANLPKGKKIGSFAQLEDIVPTVLNLLRISYDKTMFDGASLLPLISGEKTNLRDSIFAEENCYLKKMAIRNEKYKYITASSKDEAYCKRCNNFHQGVIELYDLEKDPDEKENIAKSNKEILVQMSLELEKKIKELKTLNEKRRIKQVISGL